MRTLFRVIGKVIERTSQFTAIGASGILVVVVIIIVVGTLMRYIFRSPLGWTVELSGLIMFIAAGLSMAWALKRGKHVRVEILTSRLSPRRQRIVSLATYSMTLVYLVLLFWVIWHEVLYAVRAGPLSEIELFPLLPFYALVCIGFGVFGLQALVEIAKLVAELRKGNQVRDSSCSSDSKDL